MAREFVSSSSFLELADRCDRCGAQAFGAALVNDVRLDFCGHHLRKHYDALRAVAQVFIDETHRILEG